jgi:hypothetical protein
MDAPTARYDDVAHRFREHARSHGRDVVPQPATAEEIAAAELALSCQFPDSYRWFQLQFGDFAHGPLDVYSVKPVEPPGRNIVGINLEERSDSYPPLPPHLIAFSDCGNGDLYCFDTSARAGDECPVVWWDHAADETQQPEPAGATFIDWLETELQECETADAEAPRARLDALRAVHLSWLRDWLQPPPSNNLRSL